LLDHTRFVDQRNPIYFSQRLAHQLLMNSNHRFNFPRTLPNKMLHVPNVLSLFKRHLLNILARGIAQQSLQVALTPSQLLRPLKSWIKLFYVCPHLFHETINILIRQIAFWRRAGLGYNSVWHGVSFSFPLASGRREDTMPFCFSSTLPQRNIAL
jgi:hypothetical protein